MEFDEKCKPSLKVSVTTPTNSTTQPQPETQALNIIEHCNNNKTPLSTTPDDSNNDKNFATFDLRFDLFPPGYRFRPTDAELIRFYLNNKISNEPLPPNQIIDTNLYRHSPEFLAANYKKCGENEWYFFTPRERKYLNGNRPNRAVGDDGYWKASGADLPIIFNETIIGFKKALVFYHGKPPNGEKTNWIMHEFRVSTLSRDKRIPGDMKLDDSVLCKIYKKADPKTKSNKKSTQDEGVPDSTSLTQNVPMENFEFGSLGALDLMVYNHDNMLKSYQNPQSALLEIPQNSNTTTLINVPWSHDSFEAMGGNIYETSIQRDECWPPLSNDPNRLLNNQELTSMPSLNNASKAFKG